MWCNRDKGVKRSEVRQGERKWEGGWREGVFLFYKGGQGSYLYKVRCEQRLKGRERHDANKVMVQSMIQIQGHAQRGAQEQWGVWRGGWGSQERWGLRSGHGNSGDMGLMSCGKNWPFIDWESKLLKGSIWLIFLFIIYLFIYFRLNWSYIFIMHQSLANIKRKMWTNQTGKAFPKVSLYSFFF